MSDTGTEESERERSIVSKSANQMFVKQRHLSAFGRASAGATVD